MPKKKQPHKSAPATKKKAARKKATARRKSTTAKKKASNPKPKTRNVVKKVGQVEPVPQPAASSAEDEVYKILGRVVAGMIAPQAGTPEFGQQAFGRWDRMATMPQGAHPITGQGTLTYPHQGTWGNPNPQASYPASTPPLAAPPAPFSDRMDMIDERSTMEGVFGVKRGTALPSEAKKSK